MAAYDFPNSPSDGDTVTVGGVTYTYSSSKTRWDGAAASGSSTTVYATIDDLPLSGASTGDQAYVSGNNRLYLWNGSGWYNIALINTTPSISGASATYALATDGTATTVTITATDPEGIPITYSIASDTSGNIATVAQGTGSNTNVFTITPSTNTAHAGTFSLTFRASDGVNIATAASSFTLAFTVSNSNYTTALITSVGLNNAVNNSFDDSSTSNHTITATGNVTQNTFSPYRSGGYSAYFDGSGDYLSVADGTYKTFGTGDWTIEAFIYTENASKRQYVFSDINSSGSNNSSSILLYLDGGVVKAYIQDTTYNLITGSTSITANQWHHVALVRNSTTVTLYLDGQSQGTYSIGTAAVNDSSEPLWIGRTSMSTSYDFVGYITDFRVVKGTAIQPASGGPTERITAVTNTSLLACHLPYIRDGSTNGHTITVNGNTSIEPFAPYDYQEYSASSHGGSAYFDGTGDVIYTPQDTSFNFATGDFTFEAWVYPTAYTSNNWDTIFATGNSNNNGGILIGKSDNNLFVIRQYGVANSVTTSTLPTLNTWTHIACVRSNGTSTIYYDGTSVASASDTTNYSSTTPFAHVGNTDHSTYSHYWTGYITDVRVVSGTAVYTSAFTPPTAPLTAITNTSLLLPFDDAGIIDKSQSVKTLTLNGDVKSSESEYKFLTSSMYFDGTGDYIATGQKLLPISQGIDYTVEGWFWATDVSGYYPIICQYTNSSDPERFSILIEPNILKFFISGSSRATPSISAQTWYHFALTRSGTTHHAYLDGTRAATWTTTADVADTTTVIGSFGSYYYKGHLSDIRFTQGLARYTAADETANIPSAALQG